MRSLKFAVAVFVISCSAGAQEPATTAPSPTEPGGKVLFSRSVNDTPSLPGAAAKPTEMVPAIESERQRITFLSYDLDVHLQPRQQAIAARARMRVRNDENKMLSRLPLQISSSLSWVDVRVEGATASFTEQSVNSDADHTGMLHEAVVILPRPLAPRQEIAIDATYQGTIPLSGQRLEQIGTPQDVAQRSDWDRIAPDFVGVRGFGNVVWYPVVSVPVALGDGDKFFAEVADQRLRQSEAMVTMRVTEEFFGTAPNLAVLDGKPFPVTPTSLPTSATVPGILTCTLPKTRLGFATLNLFLLARTERDGNGLQVFATTVDAPNAQAYMTATTIVQPLITHWLGTRAKSALTIVDLPETDDAPFEDGSVLFTSVQSTEPDKLTAVLAHSLTHAYFTSTYSWLQEGVANFMSTLWLEHNGGREAVLRQLDGSRGALSLAEPADTAFTPGMVTGNPARNDLEVGAPEPATVGESLVAAKDAIFYRTKATYVFWMLRDIAGDDALALALRKYKAEDDTAGTEFEQALEQASDMDLKWFFNDWVYRDRGLPDLSITGVYPNTASVAGSYIVAVDVENTGTAEAEVPVSVTSDTTTVTERLRIPPKSKITHRFLLQGQPQEVAVNDGTVPEVQASVHREDISVQH